LEKVVNLKNAAGDYMFRELALFAFKMSVPSSNAVVEKSFSVMNVIKSKLRNKMLLELLNAIMTIKFHFYVNNICCKDFQPTQDMISRFTSKKYESEQDHDGTDCNEALEVVQLCNECI
jgi:3'-phosphoadenosine 5'-phosphosulfate sulfotransferase